VAVSRGVGECGSGKKRGAQNPRISADQHGIGILRLSACQLDWASDTIRFEEFSAVPARLPRRGGAEATRSGRASSPGTADAAMSQRSIANAKVSPTAPVMN
jgi:hypothetical protein